MRNLSPRRKSRSKNLPPRKSEGRVGASAHFENGGQGCGDRLESWLDEWTLHLTNFIYHL